ncbi:hypothetical protein MBLNU230_g8573t1 [Neophaeotheca triangularis]
MAPVPQVPKEYEDATPAVKRAYWKKYSNEALGFGSQMGENAPISESSARQGSASRESPSRDIKRESPVRRNGSRGREVPPATTTARSSSSSNTPPARNGEVSSRRSHADSTAAAPSNGRPSEPLRPTAPSAYADERRGSAPSNRGTGPPSRPTAPSAFADERRGSALGNGRTGPSSCPAAPSAYADERRASALSGDKREHSPPSTGEGSHRNVAARTNSRATAGPSGPPQNVNTPSAAQHAATSSAPSSQPQWYGALTQREVGPVSQHSSVVTLRSLRDAIGARNFADVLERVHDAAFLEVNEKIVRAARILHPAEGLPRLFDPHFDNGVEWPEYLKADAKELHTKWCKRVFDTDLLRGIDLGRPASHPQGFRAEKLKDNYKDRVTGTYFGNGALVNGQWWPTQLCTVRDGAHNAMIAGICGAENEGAWSVIMSGGKDSEGCAYPDKDEGDTVLYCGTDSKTGEPTEHTRRLLESVNNHPVRLIRSHNLHGRYAPEMGFRYDGLYDVVDSRRLDSQASMRQRHQFKLVRRAGQGEIRAEGNAKRPTKQEIRAQKDDKKKRGY